MKNRIIQKPALVLILALFLAVGSSAVATINDQEIVGIRANMDVYVQASLAADWDAWGKTQLPDVVVMPPNRAPLVGRDAAVAWAKSWPKITNFTLKVDEVSGQGDLAYTRGKYAIAMTSPGGSSFNDSGLFLDIHRRQPDGTWRYSRSIWHSDAEAQASSASEQELLQVENAWSEAVLKCDTATLQRLYADEYLSTDQDGATWNKAQDLANVSSGAYTLASYKLEDMKVHAYGGTAVVTGQNTVKATFQGKDISGQYRFTDVFAKRDGRWQCVATQASLVAKK